jgi:hypothetical protein
LCPDYAGPFHPPSPSLTISPTPPISSCSPLPSLYPSASPASEAMPFQGSHPLSRDATLPNISVFPSRVKGFRSIFVSKPPPPLTTVGFFKLPGQALPLDPEHFRSNPGDLHRFPPHLLTPTQLPSFANLHSFILSSALSLPSFPLFFLLPRSVTTVATNASNPSSSYPSLSPPDPSPQSSLWAGLSATLSFCWTRQGPIDDYAPIP